MRSKVLLLAFAACALACAVLPTPAPTPTPEPTATATATATPRPTRTPEFVMLAPVEALTDQIAEERGLDFVYMRYHLVAADSEVWVMFVLTGEDEGIYKAIFKLVDDEWRLVETEPMKTPTPTPAATQDAPSPEREARRRG